MTHRAAQHFGFPAPATRALIACAVLMLTGCAHYEYDIVRPPDLAQHVGSQSDTVFTINPLLYRLRSVEDHLVIRIYNRTNDPIRLLGTQSFLVDPQGQSHPLPTQTMGPRSFIKLILPPLPPDIAPAGPTVGFGVQYGYHYDPGWYGSFYDPFLYRPRYVVYAPDGYPWEWEDKGDVRLSLTFQRDNQPPFTQEFVFHRRKM